MEKVVTFDLPYPPTFNTYWRHVGRRVLISRKGRLYRETVLAALGQMSPMRGRLAAAVVDIEQINDATQIISA